MSRICMMTTRNLNFGMNGNMELKKELTSNKQEQQQNNYKMLFKIKLCRLTHKQPFKINKLGEKRVWCTACSTTLGIRNFAYSLSQAPSHLLIQMFSFWSSAYIFFIQCNIQFIYTVFAICVHIIRNF